MRDWKVTKQTVDANKKEWMRQGDRDRDAETDGWTEGQTDCDRQKRKTVVK